MDASQDPRVRQEVLGALGELSAAAPEDLAEHIDFLLPILVQFLDDHASTSRRETGLTVLGQLAQSTSYLVNPLERDPRIIDILLDIVKVLEQATGNECETLTLVFRSRNRGKFGI